MYNGKSVTTTELQDGDNIRIDCVLKEERGNGIEHQADRTENGVLLVFARTERKDKWNYCPLHQNPIRIGRDECCEIHLEHISVSKLHAMIERKAQGYVICDCHSTNGVTVNGSLLKGKRLLHEKDIILIANAKLVFSNNGIYYYSYRSGIQVDAFQLVRRAGRKNLTICDHVNLSVKPGELVAIIGGSGAGKTTVMNCISGYCKPTEGCVQINGEDLYQNLSVFRNLIGYVPQSDIVYDNLTVSDMLSYAAKLRLPEDSEKEERSAAVKRVIHYVELDEKEKTLIKQLSGGQKKRASIAVELLSDPDLLFLDEPASGLDPGTERNLMQTLKKMALSGKTIVLVTHSTLQLEMCDKIMFMGKGGKLCFYGSYQEALQFFGVNSIVDVYSLITQQPDLWKQKYEIAASYKPLQNSNMASDRSRKNKKRGIFRQLPILSARCLKLLLNDRQRLLLVLMQAPLLALLIVLVTDGNQFEQYEMTKSVLFALACSAFWVGTLNSIQEVCKERVILHREYMTGLSIFSYISSKLIVLGILCALQAFMVVGVFTALAGAPEEGVAANPVLELYVTTFLTALSAAAMGIFVSSIFKNADRAMTVAPILLMPQILFSGLVFKLDGATEAISWLAACRWAMEGYGTTANLNGLPLKLQQQGLQIEHEAEEFFQHSAEHLAESWAVLLLFTIVFSVLSGVVLRNLKVD